MDTQAARAEIDALVNAFNATEQEQMQRLGALYQALANWPGGYRALRARSFDWTSSSFPGGEVQPLDRTITSVETHP